MAGLPRSLENLIEQLVRLPGIGRRGAERIVTHLLEAPAEQSIALGEATARLRREIHPCAVCGNWAEGAQCAICSDSRRSDERLCVVERPADLLAFEQSRAFDGRYHILGGTLSPLKGIGPDDLNIASLEKRVAGGAVHEVILATSPTVEGDATALYLAGRLAPLGVEVARIGLGLPLGASLGYADAGTLKLALEGRRKFER